MWNKKYYLDKKYYADIIIEYLKLKAAWLKEKTKLEEPFIIQEDLDAVYEFDDPELVYKNLLTDSSCKLGSSSCPHCLDEGTLCIGCAYGENHGVCVLDGDNTWDRFYGALGNLPVPTNEFLAKAKKIVNGEDQQ